MKRKFQRMLVIFSAIFLISGSLVFNAPKASAAETISYFKGKLKIPTNVGITQPYKGSSHKGIDYAGNPGESGNPIYAVYDGVVKNAGDSGEKGGGFGNWIVIEHTSPGKAKLYSVYGHMELKDISVKVGQKVKKGQQIAKIGNKGRSSGPHLHFSLSAVYPKLSYIDPTSYLEKSNIKLPKETAYNATAKITTPSGLNVRKVGNISAERIGGVYKNNTVTIVAKAGDFYKIKFGNGYGYISNNSSYVSIQAPPATKETTYNATGKIINSSGLNVRKTASESAARIGGVYKNNTVTIVAKAGAFYKIKFGTGYGYISNNSSYVSIQVPPATKETTYNATGKIINSSGLNVRKTASESAARIGGVYKNNTVTIVAKAGNFYKIKFGTGYGYISNNSSYVRIDTKPKTPTTEKEIFSEALAFTLGVEGGYVNDRDDYGGPTNLGVTQSTYNRYRDQKKLSRKNISNITFEEAKDVYYHMYWKPVKADRMDRALAIVMFDSAVNLGVNGNSKAGGAIKHLQKAMNITADGEWGSKTETAFSKYSKSQHYSLALKVVENNKAFRYERVKQDASQKKFLEGWLNRDNKLLAYIKKIGK